MATLEHLALETTAKDEDATRQSSLPSISRREQSASWYGITRAPASEWQTIGENLGGAVVDLIAYPYTPLSDIISSLDSAEVLEYRVVFHIYDGDRDTNTPWYLDADEQWVFPQAAIETLQAVSDHPALLAIYALHEPLDEGEAYVSVEQQRELYQLLKGYTGGLPVFTDMGGFSVWENRGVELSDGLCDYCRTGPSHFRSDWTSEQCLTETLRRIAADLDTQSRLMPNSQAVFAINTYSFSDYRFPIRLPTPYELSVVKDYLCELDQPMLYHPWHYSDYDVTLENAPELWPIIAAGCAHPLDKAVNRTEARLTDTLVYTLTVENASALASAFLITDTLDAGTSFLSFVGASPGRYGHAANVITWTGIMSEMSQIQLAFQATISAGVSGNVTNTAWFRDRLGGVYSDTTNTVILAPELMAKKMVEPEDAVFIGSLFSYTIVLSNTGGDVAQANLNDTIPNHVDYVDGSVRISPPPPAQDLPQYLGRSIVWNGAIVPGGVVTILFNARVELGTKIGAILENVAWIDEVSDPHPARVYRASNIVSGYELYLPVVLRVN